MGAAEFSEILVGKDLSKLFSEAVDQAQYEHGLGGYTGTIAEKHGYVDCGALPPRLSVSSLMNLIWEYQEWGWREEPRGANPVPESWRDFVKRVAEIYDDKWGPAAAIEITGAKAAEIKARRGRKGTRDRVWLVMGMASE